MALSQQLRRALEVALCDKLSADELEALGLKLDALISPALINGAINSDGSITPPILGGVAAPILSIFIGDGTGGTIAGTLYFKDAGGVVRALY